MEGFSFDMADLLAQVGSSPFYAMWYIFTHGGFLLFIYAFGWAALKLWVHWRQTLESRKKEYIVLAIDIPKLTEKEPGQSMRGVENIFAHLAGAHSPTSWREKWIDGKYQDPLSFEVVSIEGRVQFVIRCLRVLRDLVEASIFAQYPEAEINEIEDYAKRVPTWYPDREWDLYGTEMVPVKPVPFPLRTYEDFEHSMSGEFKDPIAVLLEGFSRLGPGEQAWLQLLALPIDQKSYVEKVMALVKKLKGEVTVKPPSILDQIITLPLKLLVFVGETAFGAGAAPAKPAGKSDQPLAAKMFNLSPGERKVLEKVENKASKIGYTCKLRFIYVAKKNVFKKPKIVGSFVGYIKQMNTNDMQALKPESNYVGVNGALWFMRDKRNDARKRKLISNYRGRSVWYGMPPFDMCTEELATLWHFPHTHQVRAPQLKKREVKFAEPPMNLPIG